jgi:allophanate hydrolase subunit 2
LRGPEAGAELEEVTALEWRVRSESDRRGVRLGGAEARVARAGAGERRSSGVLPGSVQLPPSGEPILLGVDAPVTGGYAWIAQVIEADLGRLAHLAPGAAVRLAEVDLEAAEAALVTRRHALDRIAERRG